MDAVKTKRIIIASLLFTRTIIHAALDDNKTMKVTARTVIITVKINDGTKLICVMAFEMYLKVISLGNAKGESTISACDLKEFMNMKAIGKMVTNPITKRMRNMTTLPNF